MKSDFANGDELISLLDEFADLEWAKCERRRPTIATKGASILEDRSTQSPYTTFRLKVDNPNLLQRLGTAVDSYVGDVVWAIVKHDRSPLPGINWTICPRKLLEAEEVAFSKGISASQYLKEQMPEFGPLAYRDMLGLVEYVRLSLNR